MTDYRQLCVELLSELENAIRVIYHEDGTRHISSADTVIAKVDAVLAQPDPVAPTDKELAELYRKSYYECKNRQGDAAQVFALRAVLGRWGNHPESPDSSTQPIPVSERLPGPEDCNSKGECWWLHPGDDDCGAFWTLFDGRYRVGYTHWLPAHALPQPS